MADDDDRNDNENPPMKDCGTCQGSGTVHNPNLLGGLSEGTCPTCQGNRRVPA